MASSPVAGNVLMAVFLVGGAIVMNQSVKQEVFPEVELDVILVNVVYPGASPEEVEQGVVLAVEEAVRGIDGVREVQSSALENVGVTVVELELGAEADRVLSDVKSSVDRITSFPLDAERPIVSLATNRQQVLSLVVYGDATEGNLLEIAEQIRQGLLEDETISFVELSGVRPLEISIDVPRHELREHGLTLDLIAQRLRAASVEVPGGGVRTQAGEVLLRTAERRDGAAEYGDITLVQRPDGTRLRVRDIARVTDGFRDTDEGLYFNGKPAVLVNVFRTGEETPVTVADAVYAYIEEHRDELPPGVEIAAWADTSEIFQDRFELMTRDALQGLVLVLLVLGISLEPKLAFWVTLGIPVSFFGSMLLLPLVDVSINMISLFAYIVSLGMIVDDAIVIGEAVYHHRNLGKSFLESAIAGAKEVAVPVSFSIFTTCIAFAPMLFVPGVMGKFFRVIPIVVILVLLVSLVETLFCLPSHLAHEMRWYLRIPLWPFLRLMKLLGYEKVARRLENFSDKAYRPLLQKATTHRYLTLACAIAILMPSCGLVPSGIVQFTFFPKIDADVVIVSMELPVGTPVEETSAALERIRQAAATTLNAQASDGKGERRYARGMLSQIGGTPDFSGRSLNLGVSSGGHTGSIFVYLVSSEKREFTAAVFSEEWRRNIGDVPGVETLKIDYTTGASAGAPIDFQLSHPDPEILERAASDVAARLNEYTGVENIDDGYAEGKQQLNLRLRPEARSLGLTEVDLARQVRSAFFGAEAGRQQRGRHEVRVYVRLPEEERQSMHNVEQFLVRTQEGGEIPLWQAAEVELDHAYTAIRRRGGRRTLNVTADVVPGVANANEVIARMQTEDVPQLLAQYPGLTLELAGEHKEQTESLISLGIGMLLALCSMFALLAIVFRSWVQPGIVLSAVPFGFVGALVGHILMGYDLSIMSALGIVALAGVTVKDSLVLIDAINQYRKQHLSLREAVVTAGARRFRPIVLTSITTFFGLAPMITETSVQARFLIPMAVALAFGVVFATCVTLVLVPSLYLIVEDIGFVSKAITTWVMRRRGMTDDFPRYSRIPAPLPGEAGELPVEDLAVSLPGESYQIEQMPSPDSGDPPPPTET